MIYKIKKNLSDSQEHYAIISTLGELLCKVAVMTTGYYLYNKHGAQLAQIKLEDGKAYLSIARQRPAYPATVVVQRVGQEKFNVSYLEPTAAEMSIVESLGDKKEEAYSVWGMPTAHNYDLYLGSKKCANVVPVATNSAMYSVNVLDVGNVLNIIMIAIAMDTLIK